MKSRLPATHRISAGSLSLLFLMLLLPGHGWALTPAAGQLIQGGSQIDYPANGVSFTLPENLLAIASADNPDHELTAGLMPQANSGDNTLYIQVGYGDLEAITREMEQVVNFRGVSLHPLGDPVSLKGGIVHNEFEIEDGSHAFMLAAVAKNGVAIIFLAVTPQAYLAAYKEAVSQLVNSLSVSLDVVAPNTQQPDGNKSPQSESPRHEIVGAWMRRSNYSNGIYIENSFKWVFSTDGRVAYGSGAIIAGGTNGVSLRGGGENPPDYGRWTITGDLLTIKWDDGTQGQWSYLVFDYDGTPILVLKNDNGTRRYRKID